MTAKTAKAGKPVKAAKTAKVAKAAKAAKATKTTKTTKKTAAAPASRGRAGIAKSASRAKAPAGAAADGRARGATVKVPRPATSKAAKGATTARKASSTRAGATATADKFIAGQRVALLEERATYTRQAESLRAEADLLAADREPGDVQFDEESGEGDTLAVERERDLALSAQAQQAVEEIDAALARIEAGTYGVCHQCGQPIPKERLRALPYAALCVRCKSGGLGRR